MGTKPFALQEVRIRYAGSTYSDAFTALNAAGWVAAGGSPATIKARAVNGPIDVSGLTTPRLEDPSVRTRGRGRGIGITGKQSGSVSLQFFLNSSNAQDDILQLLEYVFGGRQTPTANGVALTSAGVHTTSKIYATGITATLGAAAGMAVLCGTRGDGRGNGEAIPIVTAETDYLELARNTSAAMADGDYVWASHTVYPDMDATQNYFEVALIGDDSTSPDQYNLIGCQATEVSIGQINLEDGEMPVITLTVTPGRYRLEPAATKATISHTAPSGADPVALGIGGFWITDAYSASAQARGYLLGGMMEVAPNIRHVPLQDPQRYNNIGGWRRAPGAATWAFTAYGDEGSPDTPVNDHSDDFASDTHAHQVMMQFGHAADKCSAVAIDKSFLDREPYRTELNEMLAYRYEGHAEERATTTDLIAADVKLHFFHSIP